MILNDEFEMIDLRWKTNVFVNIDATKPFHDLRCNFLPFQVIEH